MNRQVKRRKVKKLAPEIQTRIDRYRDEVQNELPELIERGNLLKEAATELTLSGELRRAIHSSGVSLPQIAQQAGVELVVLGEFLTGERTLRSDVMDRVAKIVQWDPVGATESDDEPS